MAERVEWLSEYRNQEIVQGVFDKVGVIVVPSAWVGELPLVIREAQQARVPVITANAGGMGEYVHDEVNGLLFEHRSHASLARQMQRLSTTLNSPPGSEREGTSTARSGDIPDVVEHVRDVEAIYAKVLKRRDSARVSQGDGPWRITFSPTINPRDTRNMRCTTCEEHSPHSPRQISNAGQKACRVG